MYQTLIDVTTLDRYKPDDAWVIVDTRYDLADPSAGRKQYLDGHIPGALFADLHDDLSGPPLTDHGRHPLPSAEHMIALFSRLGIDGSKQVVVYDDNSGSFAGRLWWMLRFMGHTNVAVLDGGWGEWCKQYTAIQSGNEEAIATDFAGKPKTEWLVLANAVLSQPLLIDSRDPQRYRGELEPIDRVPGHIPGAINRFWQENLDSKTGRFKSTPVLAKEFRTLFAEVEPEDTVFYCGSGVTACHNLLAVAHAGLPAPRLYAGSWSDWCSDPHRPVATGDE